MQTGYTLDRALAEASRCLLCHEPPCSEGCPAGTDPGTFIRKLRLLNIKGAIATVRRNNALGGVCGALCPTATLCQQACSATDIDRPIDIGGLQRFLIEHGEAIGFAPEEAAAATGIEVAVVGAGPAGLSCAADLARGGFAVTIFDRQAAPGGIPRHVIPEHRYAGELMAIDVGAVLRLGVRFVGETAVQTGDDLQRLFEDGFAAVYLATGAWESVRLEIPGCDAGEVWDAMDFLARSRRDREGVARDVAGKEVAVIGGGDTAMDSAVTAARLGAADVYVLYRRSFGQMPGDQREKLDALRAGVHFAMLTTPLQYRVEGERLVGVKVQRNRLGAPDASGRRAPIALPGTEHEIPADLVVEAIGLRPPRELARLGGIDLDGGGRIVVSGDGGQTSAARIFAGGDAVRGPALVVQAVADGKRAAVAIGDALRGEVQP